MDRIDRLLAVYGNGEDGSAPSRAQWSNLLDQQADNNITLVNFFKMRDQAAYGDVDETAATGEEAFARYAEVSVPTVERVGGRFLLLGPCEGTLFGAEEDWDLIAVGTYPSLHALMALMEDEDYQQACRHRSAALARQKVFICPV